MNFLSAAKLPFVSPSVFLFELWVRNSVIYDPIALPMISNTVFQIFA